MVSILNDAINEEDETIEISLSNPNNAYLGTNTTHTVTIVDDDRKVLTNVKDFGAKGDAKTDDTKAIQQAIDETFNKGGGVILFPSGVYMVTSVTLKENITYQGYEATIKRPPMQGKWTRTFTTQYSGDRDSEPLIIKGLSFDGNYKNQGPFENYELEQAHEVFLSADPSRQGRLKAYVEDCVFKDNVADGLSVYTNVDVVMYNCEAIDVFRGGFVLTGGYSRAEVYKLTTRRREETKFNTGIDIEIDGGGYGGACDVNVKLDGLNLTDGDFDVAVQGGTVVGNNITSEPMFYIYGQNSKLAFTNCSFKVGANDTYVNRIALPHDITFENCEFYMTRKPTGRETTLYSIANIYWQFSWLPTQQNQSLVFKNCQFHVHESIQSDDKTYVVYYASWDSKENNNVLRIEGGNIAEEFDVGINITKGGKAILKDVTISAGLPIQWSGSGGNATDITLDGVVITGKKFMAMDGNDPANKLTFENFRLDQNANIITSPDGIENNAYVGHRIIYGVNPPDTSTHGFSNDIYRVMDSKTGIIKQWKCIKAGYMHDSTPVPSQWEEF